MILNGWTLFFTIAAAQGWFIGLILLVKKVNRPANSLLGAFLFLLALTLSEWVLWWSGAIKQLPALMGVSAFFSLLYGPLMGWFYSRTFQPEESLRRKAGWHLLPFAVALFFQLPFYLRFFPAIRKTLLWIPPWNRHPVFIALIFVQMIAYGIWVAWRFRTLTGANPELRRWHRWILGAYIGIILTYLLYRLLPWLGLNLDEWQYVIALSLSFFIGLVAWLGYIQPEVLAGVPLRRAANPIKYRKSALRPEATAALFDQVANLLESEQLYRNPQFTLEELAQRLQAPRHHVSQAINVGAGKTFAELLNAYRVREAQELLRQTSRQELHVIEVAYAVGFNTKKAFNAAFKKVTGQTPTAYRQEENS